MKETKEKKDKKAQTESGEKPKKLKRVEIILSAAVDEDFVEGFKKYKIGSHFTKISGVTGAGFSNPKLGDAVWPQLNEMIIVYCPKDEAEKIVIEQTLAANKGNKSKTAEVLGIGRKTLQRKLGESED